MTFNFRPAIASEAKPLVGLYAESGCGKTRSALLLAKGFVGDMRKVLMIETESGRGEAYANDSVVGGYNVIPLRDDFSPRSYGDAITVAEQADMRALIIDSASHEWEGAQGVLDMAAENQAAGKKGVLVWQQPKIEHARRFMLRLLQTPIALVIVCMRAKYPMQEKIVSGRKDWVRSETLEPKQSGDILYEMFIHGWIDQQHCFRGTKYTIDDLRSVLVDGEPITVDSGERLAAWAAGGATVPEKPAAAAPRETGGELRDGKAAELLEEAATAGLEALKSAWTRVGPDARKAWGDRLPELKEIAAAADRRREGGPPEVTYAVVATKLAAAGTIDAVDEAATLIELVLDEPQREELRAIYHARRDEIAA